MRPSPSSEEARHDAVGGSHKEAVGLSTIELARFRVRPENTSALLAARPRMLNEFRADRSGFIDARLVRLPDGQWLDIVSWRSPEDFAASRAKGASLPGIRAFFAAIEEVVSAEEGTLADGPEA
jgi:quinol monooxygenase YgiN